MKTYFVASSYRRICAHFVDNFIRWVFYLPALLQATFHRWTSGEWRFSLYLILSCWLLDILFRASFLRFFSATPGKFFFGLRLISQNQPAVPLLWTQAFIRVLTDQLMIFFGLGLRSMAFFRLDRTHLSDWLAETRVVQLSPRSAPPRRRWWVGLFCLFWFSWLGWTSAQTVVKNLEISNGEVTLRMDARQAVSDQ